MPSISSLLKSAESIQKRIRQQQDAEVAYEWQLSAKTYEDYQAYSKYIDDQSSKTNDPSELLSYRKATDSARSGYISNEIQRQSIDVLEGRTTNSQKKDAMTRLFFDAVDAGNLDLAQSLNLQIDNLDLRIQAEAEAAQALAGKMAALNARSIDDAVEQLKGYQKELSDLFKTKGTEKFASELGAYAEELGVEPGDFIGMHLRIAQEINGVYDNALASDTDPDNQRKFQKAKNTFNTQASIPLPGENGKSMMVTYQDIVDHADAERTGQKVFESMSIGGETVFRRNKQTGFVWGRDENGDYRPITLYGRDTDYTSGTYRTRVDSKGNTIYMDGDGKDVAIRGKDGNIKGINGSSIEDAAKRDYRDLLKQAGFEIVSGDGSDYIEIENPGDIPGVSASTVRLYVGRDGKLQVAGEGSQYYNLDFDEATGQFKGLLKDVPNPITLLDDQFSQDFISKLDKNKLPGGAIGVVDMGLASTQLLKAAEFTRADIAQKEQLAALERAREEAAKRQAAQAAQALQPALSPQAIQKVNIQAPTLNVQKPTSNTTQFQGGNNTGGAIQGNQQGKPQQSLQVQQPRRTGTISVR